jgi:HK97 family phage portal protein
LALGIVDTLRRLVGQGQRSGIGLFPIGGTPGGQALFNSRSWEFERVATSVYQNPTGYRCVEAISSNLSRPPWLVLPADAVWPQHGSEKAEKSHPMLALLNRPNAAMSGTSMQRSIGRDLELAGKSFWFKVPDAFGHLPVAALRRMPCQRVTVVGNQDDDLLGFVYTDRNGRQVPSLPENMVYLRYPHPERIYDGLAPALIAGLPSETDTSAARFNRDLLANDAALPGYLVLQGLTPEDFAEWKAQWESGAQPGRTRFLSADQASYAKVGQTNQELTYAELRRDSQDDILRAFGVPRAVAFDTADTTYANADAERAMFMQQNILPKWVLIADELTLQLGADMDVKIAFDLAGIDELQDSRDAIVERATKLMSWKAQTINEFRLSMGWAPVPWGDEPVAPLQPMSAIPLPPGGENAPPTPAATPPTKTQPVEPGPAPSNGTKH